MALLLTLAWSSASGLTAIHVAARSGSLRVLQVLLPIVPDHIMNDLGEIRYDTTDTIDQIIIINIQLFFFVLLIDVSLVSSILGLIPSLALPTFPSNTLGVGLPLFSFLPWFRVWCFYHFASYIPRLGLSQSKAFLSFLSFISRLRLVLM